MDASSALHFLADMAVTAAPVGDWPSSSSSNCDNDKVDGYTNNDSAPITGLDLGDNRYLQIQKHAYSNNERSSSASLEIARVVSNDDGNNSDEGSDDEIPDLTISRTKSFDEEENIIHGISARPLPVICESNAQSSNTHSDGIRSILYDEVRKTTERCVEMQKKLDGKATELKEVSQT